MTNPETDELAVVRATNQRLNRRAQELESELAAYRRAVADWEISEDSTYVPLRSLAVIAKAAGLEVPERWELHYERVERAEAELRRLAAEAPTTTKPETRDRDVDDDHSCAASGCSGEPDPWDVPDARPGTTDHTLTQPAAGVRQDGAQAQEEHRG